MEHKKVLFVCMGNICRSPTAHGVMQAMVNDRGLQKEIEIDSAGTHAYHIGEPPDTRSQQAALNRGIDMSSLRARKVTIKDFEYYDYILVMDNNNLHSLPQVDLNACKANVALFLDYAQKYDVSEVPDPYYGGQQGFEYVLDLVEDACDGLLKHIEHD